MTAPVLVKALIKLFLMLRLSRVVQIDQGTNFLSKIFSWVLISLKICHSLKNSSPYHPESPSVLQLFHQSLKSTLHKYYLDTQKDLDEGVPLVLSAAREAVQYH